MNEFVWELTATQEQDQDAALAVPLVDQDADAYKVESIIFNLRDSQILVQIISLCAGVEIRRESTLLVDADYDEVIQVYMESYMQNLPATAFQSGTTTSATRTAGGLGADLLVHELFEVTAGTNVGEKRFVSENTDTTITWIDPMPVACDATTVGTTKATAVAEIEKVCLTKAMTLLGYAGALA